MKANPDDMRIMLDAISAPGMVTEMRCIGPSTRQFWRDHEHRHELIPLALAANNAGRNVYLGVNDRGAIGASGNASVKRARCFFVDFDGKHLAASDPAVQRAELLARIEAACLPRPSMLVFSGHGWHAYWLLAGWMTDMDRWAMLLDSFIATLGSDTACSNGERVTRLAGPVNTKSDPVLSRLDYFDPASVHHADDLDHAFYHGNMAEPPDAGRDEDADVLIGEHKPRTVAASHDARVIDTFNDRVGCRDQLSRAGYTIVGTHHRRPGKADRGFSGIFRQNRGGIEVSCHWSDNDPLNDHKFGARGGRAGTMGIHDAFSTFCLLNHRGNVREAVKAAAAMLNIPLPRQKRDGQVLLDIQASADADPFALLYFGDVIDTPGRLKMRMADIIRRHTSNPLQVERLLATATTPTAEVGAA